MFLYKALWFAAFGILLAGCSTRGNYVPPIGQYVLVERPTQPEIYLAGPWTMYFDYKFQAQTSGVSTGSLSIESTLIKIEPWVERLRILISFLDSDGRVLDEITLLEVDEFPGNQITVNNQFNTPPGTVAIAFRGRTSGEMPLLD